MVQANLAGTKTQTRRILKAGFDCNSMKFDRLIDHSYISPIGLQAYFVDNSSEYKLGTKCPFGKPGDILWGRETIMKDVKPFVYRADYIRETTTVSKLPTWKPAIHMPFEACRIFQLIKKIRCERLLDITEEDAKAEGVLFDKDSGYYFVDGIMDQTATSVYFKLWDKINGPGSHEFNPWVWVIEYEMITKDEALKLTKK